MKKALKLSLILLILNNVCYSQQHQHMKQGQKIKMENMKPLDIASIEKITGMKGKENNGQYQITVPQNDLNVTVDGFKIIPAMGLGSWIAFSPSPEYQYARANKKAKPFGNKIIRAVHAQNT